MKKVIIADKPISKAKLYNLSMIEKISKGNPQLFNKGLTILIKMLSSEKQNILALIDTDNWEEISMIVHKIKSSLIHISVDSLTPVLNELERHEFHSDDELRSSCYTLCGSLNEILLDLNKELLPC